MDWRTKCPVWLWLNAFMFWDLVWMYMIYLVYLIRVAVIKINALLPVEYNDTQKYLKGYLGALDGTYIELRRAFGLLKGRGNILKSPSFYPVRQQYLIILACALLHNFIRTQIAHDHFEDVDLDVSQNFDHGYVNLVETIESTNVWIFWRDEFASNIFNSSVAYPEFSISDVKIKCIKN
ncbi:hypothetical protein CDL12_08129 [Handroanthus impetiginosus]|uniref:DDE Tnp4 domain-containing protein n=1 Tax=Handroanthus impetiginosus TaxID=429701 RepID=A0A2G9HP27_9LAMI|nr:hypothetical protein CDL12_08129 [Handroanthus impetiginosus]